MQNEASGSALTQLKLFSVTLGEMEVLVSEHFSVSDFWGKRKGKVTVWVGVGTVSTCLLG